MLVFCLVSVRVIHASVLLIEKGSLFVPYVTAFRAEGSLKKPQNKTFSCTQCDKAFKN